MRKVKEEGMGKTMRLKKDDLVKVIAGSHKGKTAKIIRTDSKSGVVYLENIGLIKRHVKPSQLNPRGGTKELHKGFPVSNVALVVNEANGNIAKVSYKMKENKKLRVNRSNGKEL